MKFAVVGTDHLHVVELASGLRDAGADLVAIMPTEDRIGAWLATQYASARTVATIDDAFADADVVVTAAIPGDRAEIGIAAMQAGKDVLADKPGATSNEQLAALRAAHEATGRQYLVLFSERLTNAAMVRAYDLVEAGRIGRVVHTVGLGPHTLNLDAPARLVLRPGAVRRDPRRHRFAPGRPVPGVHRFAHRGGADLDRACAP